MTITAAFYVVCVSIATWPRMLWFRSSLPDRFDALQHLWIMRWYKTCLLEGRSVFVCPEIQYPIGAPLGNFSSLHLQALFYFPLSLVIANDAICYNVIWLIGLMMTGLGTFLLIWHLLGDRACAAFGGMLAMLSGPMLIHAHGHLELIHVGWFPLFLVAWMRFVDRPSRGKLLLAALGYVVVAMSAAYYLVFAIFPAALYAVWQSTRAGFKGVWPWLRVRTPWFLGFVGLILPVLLVLFSSQFWAIQHGYSLERSRQEFDKLGAPLQGYGIPTRYHWLGTLLPLSNTAVLGDMWGERSAYLGVVSLALLAYAALNRVKFRNAGYVWAAFVLLVVLSRGAYWNVRSFRIALPSAWLWEIFPLYRMTRVPARFGLFAGVLAGVLAAAGLRHLLARLPRGLPRMALFGALTTVALADLAMVPFWMEQIPAMPPAYTFLKQRDPKAAIIEIPHIGSGGSILNASCTYWQSLHRLNTSAGYSGHCNRFEDARMRQNCPFLAERLADPDYLNDPAKVDLDLTAQVAFNDFVWLYLTVNRFDYIVLHQWAGAMPEYQVRLDRIKTLLQGSRIYEDAATIVYARSLLPPPARPVHICLEEWQERSVWQGQWSCGIPKSARVVVYNPDPTRDLTLVLDTATSFPDQAVCVRAGSRELSRWDVLPGGYQKCVSPPFRLPAGLQELTVENVSDSRTRELRENKKDTRRPTEPHSLSIAHIRLDNTPESASALARDPKPAAPDAREKTLR